MWLPSFGLTREDIPESGVGDCCDACCRNRRRLDLGLRSVRAHDEARDARRAARLGGGDEGADRWSPNDRAAPCRAARPRSPPDGGARAPDQRRRPHSCGRGRRWSRCDRRGDRRDRRAPRGRRKARLRRRRVVGPRGRGRRGRVRADVLDGPDPGCDERRGEAAEDDGAAAVARARAAERRPTRRRARRQRERSHARTPSPRSSTPRR